MNVVKIVGIVLIVAGILGLVYGSFSFTKETHEAKVGPIQLSVKEKETVNVPVWAGVGAIALGVVLLWAFGSMAALYASAALIGVSHMLCNVSAQNLVGSTGGAEDRTRNF